VRDIELHWEDFKPIVDERGVDLQWVDLGSVYNIQLIDGVFVLRCRVSKTDPKEPDQIDFEDNYKDDANSSIVPRNGKIPTSAINRIPFGYTVYPTGRSDDIATGAFGTGDALILDMNNKVKYFSSINNWYAIGGEASWDEHTSNKDYIDAYLTVPATVGVNGAGYDFTKVATGLGFNVYVPTPPGAGDWDLDIGTTLYAGKELLHVNPVPVPGNTGFFDYNKKTNLMVVNATQTGGYNLYDVELPIFSFGRGMWGVANGGLRVFKETDVVGKLLYANWRVKFELVIYDEVNRTDKPSVTIDMTTAVKANL